MDVYFGVEGKNVVVDGNCQYSKEKAKLCSALSGVSSSSGCACE